MLSLPGRNFEFVTGCMECMAIDVLVTSAYVDIPDKERKKNKFQILQSKHSAIINSSICNALLTVY